MTRSASVAIVIPTHNRQHQLDRLLASITDLGPLDEIIVVDDGSRPPARVSDERATLVRTEGVEYLAAARNKGALLATADVLIFVDDDCVVGPNAISLLADAVTREPGTAIAGPVIAYLDSPTRIWCAGTRRSRWTGLTRFPGQGADVSMAFYLPRERTAFPSVLTIRRKLFEALAGFDETIFVHHMTEDALAEQVRAKGYHVRLVPEAIFWHDVASSDGLLASFHVRKAPLFVARDRVSFICRQDATPVRKAVNLLTWLFLLVPLYLTSILLEHGASPSERLATAAAFLRGNAEGMVSGASFLLASIRQVQS